MPPKAFVRVIFAGLLIATLTACAPIPLQPLGADQIRAQASIDRQLVHEGVLPLGQRLSLEEAIARALKYNLDRRTRQFEEAFALRQFDEVGYDKLPRLIASAGYTTRSEDRTARSIDSVTGQPSLANPSIAQSRSHLLSSLTMSWSLLDYGLARYNEQQAADRLMSAGERRRKATHLLVQDVRVAYWRAASAQRLRGDVQSALALAEEAMVDSRQAEEERLRSPLDTLRYQRQLTENLRLLESIEQELVTARFELAALINAPVVQAVTLDTDSDAKPGNLLATMDADRMENLALEHNADLREHLYLRRIAVVELDKMVARAYPNISLSLGATRDSDNFLVHPSWAEAGLQMGMNLLNLLTLPAQRRSGEAAIRLAEQRRLAAHVALLAQVHVGRVQFSSAQRQFERADVLWQLDTRIMDQVQRRENARAGSKLDRVAAQTTAIISLLRRYQALAQWHAAASRLEATLGTDILPGNADDISLDALSRQVRERLLTR